MMYLFCLFNHQSMPSADVHVRVAEPVIRVRGRQPGNRTVLRVTANNQELMNTLP